VLLKSNFYTIATACRVLKRLPPRENESFERFQIYRFKERYGINAANPYDLALTYTFERVLHFLEGVGETSLPVTAEARGKIEDNELAGAFMRIVTEGTGFHPVEKFRALKCPLAFRRKSDNIAGMQVSDLCAYPAARQTLKPD